MAEPASKRACLVDADDAAATVVRADDAPGDARPPEAAAAVERVASSAPSPSRCGVRCAGPCGLMFREGAYPIRNYVAGFCQACYGARPSTAASKERAKDLRLAEKHRLRLAVRPPSRRTPVPEETPKLYDIGVCVGQGLGCSQADGLDGVVPVMGVDLVGYYKDQFQRNSGATFVTFELGLPGQKPLDRGDEWIATELQKSVDAFLDLAPLAAIPKKAAASSRVDSVTSAMHPFCRSTSESRSAARTIPARAATGRFSRSWRCKSAGSGCWSSPS